MTWNYQKIVSVEKHANFVEQRVSTNTWPTAEDNKHCFWRRVCTHRITGSAPSSQGMHCSRWNTIINGWNLKSPRDENHLPFQTSIFGFHVHFSIFSRMVLSIITAMQNQKRMKQWHVTFPLGALKVNYWVQKITKKNISDFRTFQNPQRNLKR